MCGRHTSSEPGFQLALAVLDSPVVAGRVRRAVDRDDHMVFQHVVDGGVVQVAGVVPLEEQRRSEPVEVPGQMAGDLLPAGLGAAVGGELVTGTQVLDVLDMKLPGYRSCNRPWPRTDSASAN